MSKSLLTYLEARLRVETQLRELTWSHLERLLKPPQLGEFQQAAQILLEEGAALQPPLGAASSLGFEHRERISRSVAKAWEAKRDGSKLYLYEWQGEDPERLSYAEAAEKLSLAASTLRTRISLSPSKSLLFYKWSRHLVLAKSPDGLEPALRSLADLDGSEDQVITLPKRPRKFPAKTTVSPQPAA